MTDQPDNSSTPLLGDVPDESSVPSSPPSPSEGGDSRPDWLPENFKSPEKLVESYKELQKKMSSYAVPEDYEIGVEGFELTEDLAEAFKGAGLTNSQAKAMVELYAGVIQPQVTQLSKELELTKIKNDLGLDDLEAAQAEVDKVLGYTTKQAGGNELAQIHGTSASGILLLRERMNAALEQSRMSELGKPTMPAGAPRYDKDAIQKMVSDPRYYTDPAYTKDVNDKLQAQSKIDAELASL